jgi:hypothetical protein
VGPQKVFDFGVGRAALGGKRELAGKEKEEEEEEEEDSKIRRSPADAEVERRVRERSPSR